MVGCVLSSVLLCGTIPQRERTNASQHTKFVSYSSVLLVYVLVMSCVVENIGFS
jgi:hypothetical protein